MKILFVAFSDSIHTARWIAQLEPERWDIHLFPSSDQGLTHPELSGMHIYHSLYSDAPVDSRNRIHGLRLPSTDVANFSRRFINRYFPDYRVNQLLKVIRKVKPDIVHSMEFQAAGALTLEVKRRFPGNFPPWIATNWGSDIYLFGRLSGHRETVSEILRECDYYSCECMRDVGLARELGFEGKILPVIPATGGVRFNEIKSTDDLERPSSRSLIVIKGNQGWAGRALVAIRALTLCKKALKGYQIVIYGVQSEDVRIAAELLEQAVHVPVTALPPGSHESVLILFQRARVYVGLSISDAISTSLLEAMSAGAFPIQSGTSCADEWIRHGTSGFIVPPEDPSVVAEAIQVALSDDRLVDEASSINRGTIRDRLNYRVIQKEVVEMYKNIIAEQ